jgi:hypothetical protein
MHPAARRVLTIVLLVQVALFLLLGVVLGLTVHWTFLLGFGAAALVAMVGWLSLMLAWQRADLRREALLARGVRVPASLAHTFEARWPERVVRAETKAFVHLPVGTAATIAYDAADPGKAVVVENLDRASLGH